MSGRIATIERINAPDWMFHDTVIMRGEYNDLVSHLDQIIAASTEGLCTLNGVMTHDTREARNALIRCRERAARTREILYSAYTREGL